MAKNNFDFHDISSEIWEAKYRFPGRRGVPGDKSPADSMARVARACAAGEKKKRHWEEKFSEILSDMRFLPGGRIIANAGADRSSVTMFNCYVMNNIQDSIEGIFDTVKEAALTQKQGGGVGFDFSTLRPSGAHIRGCEAHSSGPVSFMQVLDSTCRTIMSAGNRRGAQMGVMRCDHPDIEAFITAKRASGNFKMFNLSVAVTDKFVKAVKDNADWPLVFNGKTYKTVHAAGLWNLIMTSTYDFAEPGFILIDRINQMNNLWYCEEIRATNPCGEQPLPPYGACLLGSLNLTKFVKSPFTPKASVDLAEIDRTTRVAVRLLDNVIDISNYPLDAQRREALSKRRVGLGLTGLADMFMFLGVRYGSPKSVKIAGDVMGAVTAAAYEASVEIGIEKGVFPKFDFDKYPAGKFVATLPKSIRADIRKHGLRNSHLTSIAPTGTISLLAGNISSGLEPVFALKYKRKIRKTTEDDVKEVLVADHAFLKYAERMGGKFDESNLPDYFVCADKVSPEEHLDMQAALQRHVDSSISKTINIPTDYPFAKFEGIYMKACEKGLKGCTTFRPSDHLTGVLTKHDAPSKKESAAQKISMTSRPRELEGTTYKIVTPLSPDALYVTINDLVEENGRRRPYELFINTKNLQHFSWIVAMTRLISAVFRHDPAPSFLVEELKSIYDPNGGYFSDGSYVPSLAADIGRVIEKHLAKIGIKGKSKKSAAEPAPANGDAQNPNAMFCPDCNQKTLVIQENCAKCLSCGYSKCG